MPRILIVEDEKKINRFLELQLRHEGYEVDTAFDGRDGLEKALEDRCDLVVLDLMLPQLSGIEVCRRLRRESDVPVIMLTAKDDVSDKVMGLDMGADDYMTKPFAIEELLARIRVGLKKVRQKNTVSEQKREVLQIGPVRLDMGTYGVSVRGQELQLTKKEFDVLHYMMKHEGLALTRDELLNEVWGFEYAGDTNVVDVYIRYLRQKLDEAFNIKTIATIRGVGYMFRYEEKE